MSESSLDDRNLSLALRAVDIAWEELRRTPDVASSLGVLPARLPEVSPEEAARRSRVGGSLLERLARIDERTLPHELALTMRVVRFRAEIWAREADWYWTVVDPTGVGFFGLFLPTAYCGGYLLSSIHKLFSAHEFADPGDCDRYLALVSDYARLVEQFTLRTEGQRTRAILMPKPQLPHARHLLQALRSGARAALSVAAPRLHRIASAAAFLRELEHRIASSVEPAFERARAALSESYERQAPETVGLAQFSGGRDIYAELVRLYTTLPLSIEEVHAQGLARMSGIQAAMQEIRAQLGFKDDAAGFMQQLRADPRWRADSIDGVTRVFQRYIDRLAPHFAPSFAVLPKAAYGVAPLPGALQASMTFGYYDAPRPNHDQGTFFFNGANLVRQSLFNVAALTYHELVPGHHMHLATQRENETLHPFRSHSFVNAYNEGWAEYAASFAGELGMYAEPEERYGRLVMDAFLTSRLVVDTGMNALGWSLEQGRQYMREHSGMPEAEVLSESLRYSCDIPGQALAYKLGDSYIRALRERMQRELGEAFDIRLFHAAVLTPGALPLPDLEWHVGTEIERLRQRG
jgi:uncharacterized protein (DUF885 family)